MIFGKEYYKTFEYFKSKDKMVCDRCGNDLSGGGFLIHLPYSKIYIVLCGICQNGIVYSFYQDFVKNKENK